jgi:catechol 2,3-dioxygenase-like lactoylglutathione lyase family enzyme
MPVAFDHVGLSVADLPASIAFYGEAFQFTPEFEFDLDPHPIRGVMLAHPSGVRLELLAHRESRPGIQGARPIEALATRGYGHFALQAPDIDPVFAAGLSCGASAVVAPSPSPEPGVRFAFLADPEGNLVELVERA